MTIHAQLAALPVWRPEPCLIRRDRDLWPELDDPIAALDHLNLGSRLIEVMAAPYIRGKNDLPARSDSDE